MSTLTIRNLDEEVKRDLRISAARRGVSMEQEARDRLRQPLQSRHDKSAVAQQDGEWKLEASLEDILAFGRKPARPIDQKAESDALYDYLYDK